MTDDADIAARVRDAATEIMNAAGAKSSPRAQLREMKAQLKLLPVEIRGSVEMLITWQGALTMAANSPSDAARRDRIGAGVSGGLGLLIMLGTALAVPSPTPFQERVFVIVLAVCAAAAGAFLPGTLTVSGKRPSVTVRATGAIALAVFIILIYRFILQ